MVRVKIDDPPILMSINIPNENLTCGWLISEVQKRYTEALVQHNEQLVHSQWMPVTSGSKGHNPVHQLIQ